MKKTLFLFSARYPSGNAEHFIEPELLILSRYYKSIHIFPIAEGEPNHHRNLPENVVVHEPYKVHNVSKYKLAFRYLPIVVSEFFASTKKVAFLKHLRTNLRQLIQCYERSVKLELEFKDELYNTDLYVFWMEDWATTLSFLNQRKKTCKFISRVHGYDLYEDRRPEQFISWRNFQLKHTTAVIAVSQAGKDYLTKKHPAYKSNYYVSRLGTTDPGALSPVPLKQNVTIVSCKNLVPLKRVDFLAKVLTATTTPIKWVHFGGGDEMNKIKAIIENSNNDLLDVEFRGNVSRSEILSFYKNNAVDLFVHLSASEGGVPVAIQEALSFGIPILACDTGGVPEIVNEKTGHLLRINAEHSEVFEKMNDLLNKVSRNAEFRMEAKQFWKDHFALEMVTERFLKMFPNE